MSNISITYNTSTESNVTKEFSTADELKSFISNNKANFTGAMKVVCDNSITSCSGMFVDCTNIISLDLSEFNTSSVTDTSGMFYNCQKLANLDVSNFDTSQVTTMRSMFFGCSSLTSLDVSNFDITKLTDTLYMFNNCSNLKIIYCERDWNNKMIVFGLSIFDGCTNLKGAISYDSTKTNINYANPDTGYFSYLPSRKFLVNLNMDQNEIKNMLLDKRNTNSLNPVTGQIYYNITDKKTYLYNGTEWEEIFSYKEDFSLTEAQTYEPIS